MTKDQCIAITLSVQLEDEAAAARVIESLSRTVVGLALDGAMTHLHCSLLDYGDDDEGGD